MSGELKIPLNEFVLLQRGFDLPSKDRNGGNVPVVASTGIGGYHDEVKAKAPGVVIGRSGSIGGGQYLTDDFWPLNTTLWVKDFKGHNPRFVYYLLRSIDFSRFNVGTGVPTLNRNHLSVIDVVSLSRVSQNKIAECLGALDDKIQLNQRINETLEAMAQAIFKSWFVDFDPVKAKLAVLEAGGSDDDALRAAMQAIAGKDEAQLDAMARQKPEQYASLRATAELFPSAMQDSELGEVPQGWGVVALSDFGGIVCGKTPSKKKSEYYGINVPFIKIPNMHGNVFVIKANEYLSYEGAASQPKKNIPKGSVCVSCIATVGLVVIAVEDSHTNQQINSIVPSKDAYTPYLYFRMKSLNKHLHDLASGGSATLNLNTSTFSKIQILMPIDSILDSYQKHAFYLLDTIYKNSCENEILSDLRDTLLPKLLSGELTVSEV